MRSAILALAATLVFAPLSAQAAGPGITFQAPAQVHHVAHANNATWAFISFDASPENHFQFRFPQSVHYDNITEIMPFEGEGSIKGTGPALPPKHDLRTIPPFSSQVTFPQAVASLYIEGESIAFEVSGAQGNLQGLTGCVSDLLDTPERNRHDPRPRTHCPADGVSAVLRPDDEAVTVTLSGRGLRVVEWHHASVMCSTGSECPDGGARDEHTVTFGPQSATAAIHGFNRLESQAASIQGSGRALLVAVGAPILDLGVDGRVRLPLASGSACAACEGPDNQTLIAEGNLVLRNWQANPNGTMAATLEGDISSARFDEVAIDPDLLLGGTAVGTVAVAALLGLLLKWLGAPLFTRRSDKDPLDNERRRALYDFIVGNPGAHFREALRAVSIPSGAGRHHVNRLIRAGLVAEKRVGSKLRLFQAGKHTTGWQDQAALRSPHLRALYEWIAQNPNRSQKEILTALARSSGWNPSTTQGRLARLVRDGVVQMRSQGRYKQYAVARASLQTSESSLAVALT